MQRPVTGILWCLFLLTGLLLGGVGELSARVKLITLPVRERVEIRLDHPQATLVEEERVVPLVQGINQVDFSWNDTLVDVESILFRLLPGTPLEAKVLSVSYPPNENALVWQVSADRAGAVRVHISYLLGGLDKQFYYRAVANQAETFLELSHYLRLKNHAHEAYALGTIRVGDHQTLARPIGMNETRELLLKKYSQVPIRKRYLADYSAYGYIDSVRQQVRVPMYYLIKNDEAHGFGGRGLPFGKVRLFQEDGQGGTAFVGEDWGEATPPDEEMALYLGVARDIVVKRTIEKRERRRITGNLYDDDLVLKYEIENFKNQAVILDIGEDMIRLRAESGRHSTRGVEWVLGHRTSPLLKPDLVDSNGHYLLFHVPLAARVTGQQVVEKKVLILHLVMKNEW